MGGRSPADVGESFPRGCWGAVPPRMVVADSVRVAGWQGITLADAVECWVHRRGQCHMGVIERVSW